MENDTPEPGAVIRTVYDRGDDGDGEPKVKSLKYYVAVDGEWVPVPELIEVWRAR